MSSTEAPAPVPPSERAAAARPRSWLSPRTWLSLLFSETERVSPTGVLGVLVALLSLATVGAVGYLALFASASQHLHVSWFIALYFPLCFLTTSLAKGHARTTPID